MSTSSHCIVCLFLAELDDVAHALIEAFQHKMLKACAQPPRSCKSSLALPKEKFVKLYKLLIGNNIFTDV